MVEVGQEFDESSNSKQSRSEPALTGELLDVFRAFTTVTEELRLIYLLFLQGLDSSAIAHALDLRYSEVEKRIYEAKDILLGYAISLVDAEIERMDVSGPETSSEEKPTFAQKLIEAVPQDQFEVYRRYRRNETVDQIARNLGLTEENVVRFDRVTRLLFLEQINLSIQQLTKIDSNSPPPFDQLVEPVEKAREIKRSVSIAVETRNQLKSESRPKLSQDERLVSEKLYFRQEAVYREVFELDAVEVNETEIADILDIEPETVRIRLKKARRLRPVRYHEATSRWASY